jgi:D-glycerate 3-kinase
VAEPSATLVDLLAGWIDRGRTPLIGVAGSQGSGKTTLCAEVARIRGAAHFSIDDVYLTRAERVELGRARHPLLATRGPPGTHDLDLARATIAALRNAAPADRTSIPAFDKLADDRAPHDRWPVFAGQPSAVLVDGWCVGATAQAEAELIAPANALERERDPDGAWRRWVNDQLAGRYAAFFAAFDAILFLAAPSWEIVLDWRCEQEAGLMGIAPSELPDQRRAALAAFVSHYERVSRHMLAGGVRADATALLAEDRTLERLTQRRPFTPGR